MLAQHYHPENKALSNTLPIKTTSAIYQKSLIDRKKTQKLSGKLENKPIESQ